MLGNCSISYVDMKTVFKNNILKIYFLLAAICLFACSSEKSEAVLSVWFNDSAVGAIVYVDGEKMGTMESFGGGSRFVARVNKGSHIVAVKKNSKSICEEKINIQPDASEHYVNCEQTGTD